MAAILYFLGRVRYQFFFAVFLSGIAGVSCSLLAALVTQALRTEFAEYVFLLTGFSILLATFAISIISAEYLLTALAEKVLADLRIEISRRLLETPLRKIESIGTSDILAILTSDIHSVVNALGGLAMFVMHVTLVIGCHIYLAWLSPELFLLNVLLIALGVVFCGIPMLRTREGLQIARESMNLFFNSMEAMLYGITELLMNRKRKQAYLKKRIVEGAVCYRRLNTIAMARARIAARWAEVWILLSVGVILFCVPFFDSISAAQFTEYLIIALFMLGPISAMFNYIPEYARLDIAMRQIQRIISNLEESSTTQDGSHRFAEQSVAKPHLSLKDVEFTYTEEGQGAFTLGPLSLELQGGELIFLVGGNGSGKTTLSRLICGLYPPDRGSVVWNHAKVTENERDDYRQLFSVIFSEPFLFKQLDGFEDKDASQLDTLLKKLKLDHRVRIDQHEFSTIALSHGQRKRIALLISLLEDRPVHIFDEVAAGQDPNFRRMFYEELLFELKNRNKIIMVITHDDQYFHLADRIIKMDSGLVQSITSPSASG